MSDGATGELIWHFMGYFRLPAEGDGPARVGFDTFRHKTGGSDDALPAPPDAAPPGDLPEQSSNAAPVAIPPSGSATVQGKPFVTPADTVHVTVPAPADVHVPKAMHLSLSPALPADGHGSVTIVTIIERPDAPAPDGEPQPQPQAPAPLPYQVNFAGGGDDKLASIAQTNLLDDDDRLIAQSDQGLSALHTSDVKALVGTLLSEAKAAMPADLVPAGSSPQDWLNLVGQRDAAMKADGVSGGSVDPGIYVNGSRVDTKPTLPAAPSEPSSQPGSSPDAAGMTGHQLETGGNTALNVAVIADANDVAGTLVVVGDYFETNAIVQANVYADRDQVLGAGNASPDDMTGGNTAQNIATFALEAIGGHAGTGISQKGLTVDVTVVNGDLFDVKTVVQRNWISDNDEAIHSTSAFASSVFVGGNTQVNEVRFVDLGTYDVVIVLGDYHDFNLISQVNILIDDDILVSTSGDDAAQGGDNQIVNDAVIENRGLQGFDAITDDLSTLIGRLSAGEQPSLGEWSSISGSASGHLSVLLVTGDYWDINVISQQNVIVDADVAVVAFPGAGNPQDQGLGSAQGIGQGQGEGHGQGGGQGQQAGPPDTLPPQAQGQGNGPPAHAGGPPQDDLDGPQAAGGGQNAIATGGNVATNAAAIVDAGAVFAQHLGGQHYTDAILVQADYVDATASVVNNDTLTLVYEAVAFAALQDDHGPNEHASAVAKGIHGHGHDDLMGSVLT